MQVAHQPDLLEGDVVPQPGLLSKHFVLKVRGQQDLAGGPISHVSMHKPCLCQMLPHSSLDLFKGQALRPSLKFEVLCQSVHRQNHSRFEGIQQRLLHRVLREHVLPAAWFESPELLQAHALQVRSHTLGHRRLEAGHVRGSSWAWSMYVRSEKELLLRREHLLLLLLHHYLVHKLHLQVQLVLSQHSHSLLMPQREDVLGLRALPFGTTWFHIIQGRLDVSVCRAGLRVRLLLSGDATQLQDVGLVYEAVGAELKQMVHQRVLLQPQEVL
mmetsp:Transcript_28550/g.73560  ORF Transcript_28550/g.73560 Transcript_28550/m.73560 type:complete len:271 (-) Transcript_28550:1137-1949(-)